MAELKYDYFINETVNQNLRNAIGDKTMLNELLRKIKSKRLSPCPFCGENAVVALSTIYNLFALRIECRKCKCCTQPYTNGFNMFTQKQRLATDCLSEACKKWENRINKNGLKSPKFTQLKDKMQLLHIRRC